MFLPVKLLIIKVGMCDKAGMNSDPLTLSKQPSLQGQNLTRWWRGPWGSLHFDPVVSVLEISMDLAIHKEMFA